MEGLPTRGEGMPMNRGGDVVPITRASKKRADKDAELKVKQDQAKEQLRKSFIKGKPTREEVGNDFGRLFAGLSLLDQKFSDIGVRVEALIQAERKLDARFSEVYTDCLHRMLKWREKTRALDLADFTAKQIVDQVVEWNQDPENPPIKWQHFTPGKLESKIIADLDMTPGEKIEAMEAMSYPKPLIDEARDKIYEVVETA